MDLPRRLRLGQEVKERLCLKIGSVFRRTAKKIGSLAATWQLLMKGPQPSCVEQTVALARAHAQLDEAAS